MGGLLFNTQRLGLLDYLAFSREISSILTFYGIEFKIPRHYRIKKSFGDLDVIVKTETTLDMLIGIFRKCEYKAAPGGEMISFNFKNFQIDFIRIAPENFEIACYYFNYNDLGNLIGQLAKQRGLKFGMDGLKYNHYVKGQLKGTIYISKDINKILEFLDLDPTVYHRGFTELEDIFDFVIKSKYFNPYVSDLEPYGYDQKGVALYRLSKINRERNSKRKTYMEWLDYIKKYKTDEEKYPFRETDINKIFNDVEKAFPECAIRAKIGFFLLEEQSLKKIKEKFNGNVIIKLLPELPKEDYQIFMDSFKTYVSKKYTKFDNFVAAASQDLINGEVMKFYKLFKERYYE